MHLGERHCSSLSSLICERVAWCPHIYNLLKNMKKTNNKIILDIAVHVLRSQRDTVLSVINYWMKYQLKYIRAVRHIIKTGKKVSLTHKRKCDFNVLLLQIRDFHFHIFITCLTWAHATHTDTSHAKKW